MTGFTPTLVLLANLLATPDASAVHLTAVAERTRHTATRLAARWSAIDAPPPAALDPGCRSISLEANHTGDLARCVADQAEKLQTEVAGAVAR